MDNGKMRLKDFTRQTTFQNLQVEFVQRPVKDLVSLDWLTCQLPLKILNTVL
jgi:hypothetical protein